MITEDQKDRLGWEIDSLDALTYSIKMPVNPKIHVDALSKAIPSIRDALIKLQRDDWRKPVGSVVKHLGAAIALIGFVANSWSVFRLGVWTCLR